MCWAGAELGGAELGDSRRSLRLMRIVESLVERPGCSLPQSFGSEAEVKAAYRFFENDQIEWREILKPHAQATRRRALERQSFDRVVLVAQDTTEINLSSHPATTGLGYLGSPKCRGVMVHTCFAISSQGTPLGVVDQQQWVRSLQDLGQRNQRHSKQTADKESQRWIDGLLATQAVLADHPRVVLIGDRESDIYDLFATPRQSNIDLLVRVRHEQRGVVHEDKNVAAALANAPIRGQIEVSVPRSQGRPARQAKLTVRWITLAIKAPRKRRDPPVPLQFLLAEEEAPPAGEKAIRWVLATTLPIHSLEDAARCLQWYVYRWRIERFHYTIKSGFLIEEQQFEHVDRVRRAIATYSIAAWRLLWLMYTSREQPELPCHIVLDADEWQALYATTRRRREPPQPSGPLTLHDAVRRIGRLGGHLGKTEPGIKSLWTGLARLRDITTGWRLPRSPPGR